MKVDVFKVPMASPDDLGGLVLLIKEKNIRPEDIVAIIAKTEGNGNVNDFTRGFAASTFQSFLSEHLHCSRDAVSKKVSIVCSGGCEGVMSPHATIFAKSNKSELKKGMAKRLAIGVKNTGNLLPEQIGTTIQAKGVAQAVREAMADAGIENTVDVHFVQIKCPLLTSERMNNAEDRGKKVVTKDTLKSMAFSRGASALGVALALKEIEEKRVTDCAICNDWTLFSNVASTSAGIELMNNEIVVMGNSPQSSSNFVIGHSVMKDLIDTEAIWAALKNAGVARNGNAKLSEEEAARVLNVFAKAGAHPSGLVRGRRITMVTDSDISSTRHARAVVNAVIAGITGDPMVYVSGGTEHQGPLGGGPIAVIAYV
ncbi:MAG TPA: ring-opening amidohydrolase [Nitrososphaera sp.]|jgi:cyanuric acid amidohydrolase|nr:ring-opening amidohydrolase [Nitrososphaera sp.]